MTQSLLKFPSGFSYFPGVLNVLFWCFTCHCLKSGANKLTLVWGVETNWIYLLIWMKCFTTCANAHVVHDRFWQTYCFILICPDGMQFCTFFGLHWQSTLLLRPAFFSRGDEPSHFSILGTFFSGVNSKLSAFSIFYLFSNELIYK